MSDESKKAAFSADDIKATDFARRTFLRRLGRVGMVVPALPLLAACGGSDDCDSDTGDPVENGASDNDSGDPCDSD